MHHHGSRILAFVALAALAVAPGCAGYRLGSTLPPEIQLVHVPTFVNDTTEPQIEGEVTQAVIREIQKDGTLTVVGADEADAILNVTLTKYALEPLVSDKDNPKSTREYRMRIWAKVSFIETKNGQPLVQRTVQGKSTFDFDGDLGASKVSALPKTATDLAHNIVECVVEYW